MERFFLILALASLSSCQLPSIIPADQYQEAEPMMELEAAQVYENVWQRIL